MRLVVNTNILFSFFRENPVRDLIVKQDFFGLELYSPKYALSEIRKNISDAMKYSGIKTADDFEFIMSSLEIFIEVKSPEFFMESKPEAENISPHTKDVPFFALALKLDAGIWSNEPRLKKQSKVKVYTTSELLKELGLK